MESISTAIAKLNYPADQALALRERFEPFEKQAKEWETIAKALVVTDISQKQEMADARAARLALRQIRLNVKKKHEEEKAEFLKKGQMLDLIKRTLDGLIEPLEAHLQAQEDFAKVQEEKARVELLQRRMAEIQPYRTPMDGLDKIPFDVMDEDAFNTLLFGLKAAQEAREAAKKQAEQKKLDDERIAKEEREKRNAENERLKKIQTRQYQLSVLGFKWDEEKKAHTYQLNDDPAVEPLTVWGDLSIPTDDEFKVQLEHAGKYIQASQEARKKKADEFAAKLKAETEAREKLEREKREREAAEEKARKEKAAQERALKRAPDKIKLMNFAERIELLAPVEGLKDEESQMIYNRAWEQLKALVTIIKSRAEKL